jgi:hypothetical protein
MNGNKEVIREAAEGEPDSQEFKIFKVRSSSLSEISGIAQGEGSNQAPETAADFLTYDRVAMRREEADFSPVDIFLIRSSQRKDAVACRKIMNSAAQETMCCKPLMNPWYTWAQVFSRWKAGLRRA